MGHKLPHSFVTVHSGVGNGLGQSVNVLVDGHGNYIGGRWSTKDLAGSFDEEYIDEDSFTGDSN